MNQRNVHISYHPIPAIELNSGRQVTVLIIIRSFYGTMFQIKEDNKGNKADNIFYPDWLMKQKFKRITQTQQKNEHNDNIQPIESGFRS